MDANYVDFDWSLIDFRRSFPNPSPRVAGENRSQNKLDPTEANRIVELPQLLPKSSRNQPQQPDAGPDAYMKQPPLREEPALRITKPLPYQSTVDVEPLRFRIDKMALRRPGASPRASWPRPQAIQCNPEGPHTNELVRIITWRASAWLSRFVFL